MAPYLAERISSRKINKIMSDIKNILSKLDIISEQVGFRPGARDFSGQRIEPKFDFSPVQDITPPMGAVGGTAKPRIKVQPGQSPRQAISQAQEKIPTLRQEIPSAKPSVDPYGRLEPKLGDMSKQQSFVGKRKDPGGPLPAASKSNEPTLEQNDFPGYLKGTASAKDVEKKMVGMEEEMLSEYDWLKRTTEKLKARDPYKTYEPDDQGFTFTPEQEQWLGGANRQDPDILKRMPGPKPPVSYFKNADDQRRAQELNFGRQNLNTVRDVLGKEKLAPEKFPTTRGGGSGQITGGSGLTRPVSLGDPSKTTSALPSGFEFNMAADDAGNASVPSSISTPSVAPVSPSAVTTPVRPPTPVSSYNIGNASAGDEADSVYQGATTRVRPAAPDPVRNPAEYKNWVNDGIYMQQGREDLMRVKPYPQVNTPQNPSSPSQKTSSSISVDPSASVQQRMAQYRAQKNNTTMAENKHNIVNRLSRQFENYLDNRFDIVENNYIPKKKNLG